MFDGKTTRIVMNSCMNPHRENHEFIHDRYLTNCQ